MELPLEDFLVSTLADGFVPWVAEQEAARLYGKDAFELESAILEAGLLPSRYARNAGSLGLEGQSALHKACVLVAGCGGLGGHLILGLARLGVGSIVAVDPDVFDESNLNRQALCTTANLGQPKVKEAERQASLINPACRVQPHQEHLDPDNANRLLAGAGLALDGLDSISARIALSEACARNGIPLVHAAVAGWYGQVSTQSGINTRTGSGATPESRPSPALAGVARLYGPVAAMADRGDEQQLGNQVYGPAFAAAVQLAEACRIITGKTPALENQLYTYDLSTMEIRRFELG
ncbi:MAG: ThiF family adenylyltransferase [Clostridia bacterium]